MVNPARPQRPLLWAALALCALVGEAGPARAIPPTGPPQPAPTAATPAPARPPLPAKPATAPRPAVAKKPTPPAAPPKPAAPPQPAACAPGESIVVMLPTDAELVCNDMLEDCQGEITLTARNCTNEFQMFKKVEFIENGRRSQVLEFSPAMIAQPGGLWRERIPVTEVGELEAVVYFHPPGVDTGDSQSARGPVKVVNKALAAAKLACEACQGTWGRSGVNKYQRCNCKTKDAGKVCYDGDECEGVCVFRRYDSDGREEGTCSETQRLSGCIGVVWKGQSKIPPRLPPMRKTPTCLD